MAFITGKHLSRRTFIRGLGASVALPSLDAMVPAGRLLRDTAQTSGFTRLVCIEESMGAAGCNDWGATQHLFAPEQVGRDFEFVANSQLAPLAEFRDYMTIVSQTDCRSAEAFQAEEIGGDHDRSTAVFLTQSHPKQTQGSDIHLGTSLDQMHAQRYGRETALPSLELCIEGIDRGGGCAYNYHCAYATTLAWASKNQPLPAIREPRVVFERLFGAGDTPEDRAARRRTDRSMIDWIATEVARLKRTLGHADRVAMDEYLGHIRELERRIQLVEARNQSGDAPEMPESPSGVPDSFEEHMQLMFDLQVLALQADLTRVITFKTGFDLSNRTFPESGTTASSRTFSRRCETQSTAMRPCWRRRRSCGDRPWGIPICTTTAGTPTDPGTCQRRPRRRPAPAGTRRDTNGERVRQPDAEDRARGDDRVRRQHGKVRPGPAAHARVDQ